MAINHSVVVYKNMKNEKERSTTITKVTTLNTVLPESLNKQAGQNIELNKRNNMERARNQLWDKKRGRSMNKLSEKDKL